MRGRSGCDDPLILVDLHPTKESSAKDRQRRGADPRSATHDEWAKTDRRRSGGSVSISCLSPLPRAGSGV